MGITAFNTRWLQAWSKKDSERLIADFYATDVIYRDPRVPGGVVGSEALRQYLDDFFARMPPMHYDADGLWPVESGYVARWICTLEPTDGPPRYWRGLELVRLRDGKITWEEVYTHNLPGKPG